MWVIDKFHKCGSLTKVSQTWAKNKSFTNVGHPMRLTKVIMWIPSTNHISVCYSVMGEFVEHHSFFPKFNQYHYHPENNGDADPTVILISYTIHNSYR